MCFGKNDGGECRVLLEGLVEDGGAEGGSGCARDDCRAVEVELDGGGVGSSGAGGRIEIIRRFHAVQGNTFKVGALLRYW